MVELLEKLLSWWPVSTDLRKDNEPGLQKQEWRPFQREAHMQKPKGRKELGWLKKCQGTSVWEHCGHMQRVWEEARKGAGRTGAHLPMPLISGISLSQPVPTALTQLPSYFFSSFIVVYRDTAHEGTPWLDSPRVVCEEWDAGDKLCNTVPGIVSPQGEIGILKKYM